VLCCALSVSVVFPFSCFTCVMSPLPLSDLWESSFSIVLTTIYVYLVSPFALILCLLLFECSFYVLFVLRAPSSKTSVGCQNFPCWLQVVILRLRSEGATFGADFDIF